MTGGGSNQGTAENDFNSHAHVERDEFYKNCKYPRIYFNSHAHVERDVNGFKNKAVELISTHTLTWSVTNITKIVLTRLTISTHTLTWSVTGEIVRNWINAQFQLTRSRGA